MATSTFLFISDASHGWLQVLKSEVEALGLAEKISSFSYYNPQTDFVYLEEDKDFPLFMDAYKAKYGDEIKLRESYQETWIGRDRYLPYKPSKN